MRTDHLTLDELERLAYITGDLLAARACQYALGIEQDALDDAHQQGYDAGYEDGEAFGYEQGLEAAREGR